MTHITPTHGHRSRLRQRFLANAAALSDAELLELLLTFAVPRQDVAPHARALLDRFGNLPKVLAAAPEELLRTHGIGEQAALLVNLVSWLAERGNDEFQGTPQQHTPEMAQISLFSIDAEAPSDQQGQAEAEQDQMRTFANDETANALALIPEAHRFTDVEEFRAFLRERLPYNSISTRQRRANYIIDRFFPEGQLNTPLAYYAAHCGSVEDLKPALFYHLLRAEPLAAKVADELVWPAVPLGQVERERMREFVLRYLPEISPASQAKVLQSLSNSFTQLGVAAGDGTGLRFQIHSGTLAGFLYVLTALFPRMGMYPFTELENGPMRRWLLWDRDWMRRQLYNLRDLGIVSKVSEIDTSRQFTVGLDQAAALQRFFAQPPEALSALRETPAAAGD